MPTQISTLDIVLAVIRAYQAKHHTTPTVSKIATLSRTSRTTAWRALHALDHKCLEITSRPGARLTVVLKDGEHD